MTKVSISRLNGLIETCKDAENGYLLASKVFEGTDFMSIFKKYAEQRHRFALELQERGNLLGGSPGDSGSISASLQRGWLNIKSMISGESVNEILDECLSSEDTAIENYKNALSLALPANLKSLIRSQYEEIKKARDHLSLLEKGLG